MGRLCFSEEERADPVLEKPIAQVEIVEKKLEAAERKAGVKKKQVQVKQAEVPEAIPSSAKPLGDSVKQPPAQRLQFEQVNLPSSSRKPSQLAKALHAEISRQVSASNEDENVGVEAAQLADQASTTVLRGMEQVRVAQKQHRQGQVERATQHLDRANIRFLQTAHARDAPQTNSQSFAHQHQKRAIRRAYMEAKAGRHGTTSGVASTARKAVRDTEKASRRAVQRGLHRPKTILLGLLAMLLLFVCNSISACAPLGQTLVNTLVIGAYPATEEDVQAAERVYAAKERALQDEISRYEVFHPGYDEYRVTAQEIWHDPYVLLAIISACFDGEAWTIDDAYPIIERYFSLQYILTEQVETVTRYHDDEAHTPYEYTICTVTLKNRDLSHLLVYTMSHHTMGMYALYMSTHGQMEGIFAGNPHATPLKGPMLYDIPQETLDADPTFAALMEEANKYVDYPYVWGGASPETSFDCSGFVSYVFTNSGVYNTGRLGATGLYHLCTEVPMEEVRPGDLVFFQGTMGEDVGGITHVGIYVGDNKMIHCGSPIGYADLAEAYWRKHFFGYGRIP